MNVKRGENTNDLVRNMGPGFMRLLDNFSPQKMHNAREGSEYCWNHFKYIPPETDHILVFLDALSFSQIVVCFQIYVSTIHFLYFLLSSFQNLNLLRVKKIYTCAHKGTRYPIWVPLP